MASKEQIAEIMNSGGSSAEKLNAIEAIADEERRAIAAKARSAIGKGVVQEGDYDAASAITGIGVPTGQSVGKDVGTSTDYDMVTGVTGIDVVGGQLRTIDSRQAAKERAASKTLGPNLTNRPLETGQQANLGDVLSAATGSVAPMVGQGINPAIAGMAQRASAGGAAGASVRKSGPHAPGPLGSAINKMGQITGSLDETTRDYMGKKAGIMGAKNKTIDEAKRIATSQGQEEYDLRNDQYEKMRSLELRQEQLRNKELDDANKYMEETQNVWKEYKQAGVKPSQAFSGSKGTFALVGTLLGAFGDALNSQVGIRSDYAKQAIDQLNKYIDRDIAAQEANMDKLGKSVSMRRNITGDMLRLHGHKESARMSARLLKKQAFLEDLDLLAKDYENTSLANKFEQMRIAVYDSYIEDEKKTKMAFLDKAAQATMNRGRLAGIQSSEARGWHAQRRLDAAASAEAQGGDLKYIGGLARRKDFVKPSGENLKEMTKNWVTFRNFSRKVATLIDYTHNLTTSDRFTPEAFSDLQSKMNQLKNDTQIMSKLKDKMGANYSEFEQHLSNFPDDITDFAKSDWMAVFEQKFDGAVNDVLTEIDSRGWSVEPSHVKLLKRPTYGE